ncbi:TIGR02281 family clan AA aspartic protease [Albimonas sp. CAU 1670]|uniref:retropepsin-like aspartic protease family protein n=1 Tax=Albimonas sp. CAU 1670 TaxID=3032599 RepID=UPI0023DB6FA7|nr:TIGR02281 family clan AA aspartic protease [Albimonas sp. CAU 1670]MDF2232633.1 TIGR02281 family clan AA aspartic protease [Albimonas sp. CAU 1670]
MDAFDGIALERLVYLVLLLAVVVTGVATVYRGRMGTGLRDALLWGLIFIGFVAVYGLREDLAASFSSAPSRVTSAGEIVAPRSPDGHFRVRAEVNDVDIVFMVDTGASGVVLTAADARRAGFDPGDLVYSGRAKTANGEVRLAPIRLERLRLGDVEAQRFRASVSEGDLFSSLMGMDFLERFSRVTVEGDRMTLTP